MSETLYQLNYQVNQGLVVSPSFLIDMCFYGVKLCTVDGRSLSQQVIEQYLLAAQDEVERMLNIKLKRQIIAERKDFSIDDWRTWGFIRTTYPANSAFEMTGYVNTIQQVNYPVEWLSVRKTNDGVLYQKNIWIVPVGNATTSYQSIVFSGITPHLGFRNLDIIPNYWNIVYGTGFDKIPNDIIKAICYLAAIPIYMWLGNAILQPGLNSYSIGIDGLSQSKSTEAGGYTTRIKQLKDELGDLSKNSSGLLKTLREYYGPTPNILAL